MTNNRLCFISHEYKGEINIIEAELWPSSIILTLIRIRDFKTLLNYSSGFTLPWTPFLYLVNCFPLIYHPLFIIFTMNYHYIPASIHHFYNEISLFNRYYSLFFYIQHIIIYPILFIIFIINYNNLPPIIYYLDSQLLLFTIYYSSFL